ncbi:MAG: radical SAM protein, partial [Patescibacteria group bacterium]
MSTITAIKSSWLTVNSSCQLRCAWCYAKDRDYDPKGDVTCETAIRLIDIMSDLGVETCKILGGEPSIYPHIVPILNRLKQRSIRSVIITNGIRYSDREVMRRHFEAGLDSLIISLKAGSQATYKELTGAPVLDRVHQAVKNLQEFRGGVTITITQEMQDEIIPAISDVVSVGAKFINLHFCSPTVMSGAPENHSMIAPDKAAIAMMIAVEHLEKLGVSYNV